MTSPGSGILLDTHTLLWWVNGDAARLSSPAVEAIEAELDQGRLYVSSISAWEIAMLVMHGRIALNAGVGEWLARVIQIPALQFVPLDNRIAITSTELPGEFHKDPADRFIVATALTLSVPVVSADVRIRGYAHVRTIW